MSYENQPRVYTDESCSEQKEIKVQEVLQIRAIRANPRPVSALTILASSGVNLFVASPGLAATIDTLQRCLQLIAFQLEAFVVRVCRNIDWRSNVDAGA